VPFPRLIPVILIDGDRAVKTTKFKNKIYIGDPVNIIKVFNEKEVDELVVIDIEATKKRAKPDYEMIERLASECFMPLTYGGGISDIGEADRIFSLGVEKISIQSAVFKKSNFISECAHKFGNQSMVLSLDIKKNIFGKYQVYDSSKNISIKGNWKKIIKEYINMGFGEIMVNSVDRDGLMKGLDYNLISQVSEFIDIPLISVGGVSSLEDINRGLDCGSDAIAAGSFFIFHGPHKAVLISYPDTSKIKTQNN